MKKHVLKGFQSVKKLNKKAAAVLLAVIMLVSSLPIALAADPGSYDPTPAFPDNTTISAYYQDDGSIHVVFSAATARQYPGKEAKTIRYYQLSLYNLGDTLSMHQRKVEYEKTVTVTDPARAQYSLDITAAELSAAGVTLEDGVRYNVQILAVDSTGWISEPVNALVSDVPRFEYDADAYAPLTENAKAVREMMTFESGGTPTGLLLGGSLVLSGIGQRSGVIDPSSGMSSSALNFYINSATGGEKQSFDTSYSRQTYDFSGADEVWFWMDLSQVELQGLSFRLRANEKYWQDWNEFYADGDFLRTGDDDYGSVVYSTAGYKGGDGYVFLQNETGAWEKVPLKADGTIDLGNYKGYIRIPLEFMCSETDSIVTVSNQEIGVGTKRMNGNSIDKANISAWLQSLIFTPGVVADPAGTNIADALLLQKRQYKSKSGLWGLGTEHTIPVGPGPYDSDGFSTTYGSMLAPGIEEADVTSTAVTGQDPGDGRAYIANGAVVESSRETGYKAIEDLYSAGFAFTGVSADSVNKRFFMDNVLFYRTDGQAYPENTLDGNVNTGDPASKYYDQKTEIANSILSEIDAYLSSPDLADFAAVRYIEELIEGYRTAFAQADISTDFLSEASLAALASSKGVESWNNFLTARSECWAAGTITPDDPDNPTQSVGYPSNATAYDLVPELVRSMEKLPAPEDVVAVSDQLNTEIRRLYQLYRRLNLAQLDALSTAEEQRLLDYFALVTSGAGDAQMDIVGQSLADNKFILFNDFDSAGQTEGTQAWHLENYPNIGSGVYGQDYRYTKGFLTYTTKRFRGFVGADSDATGYLGSYSWSIPISDGFRRSSGASHEADTDPLYVNQMTATIAGGGFNGTNAAVVQLNGQGYSGEQGFYNVLSVTYQGQDGTIDSLLNNNMGQFNLGQFAGQYNPGSNDETKILPLALAFYVDFSELSDFRLSAVITTKNSDGNLTDYTLDMGISSANRKYWLLNPDTGEWVCCYSGRIYGYNSSDGTDGLSLDHYKGWVMLPLYHFKGERSGIANTGKLLDETASALNGICRVQIGVAPNSDAAAVAMTGASYTIDTIGFAYQPSIYPGVTGRNDTTFDEVCGAKSLPSQQFEDSVAGIEINGSTFASDVAWARAAYNLLTDYQKTLRSVVNANERLTYYEQISNGEIPESEYMYRDETDAFIAWVDALPDGLKNAQVTDNNDLPYPGYLDTDGDGMADAVNYAAFDPSFTKELAAEIIEYYNLDYARYTTEQKQSIGTERRTQFINAYNAAMRCYQTLEQALAETTDMLTELTNVDNADSLYKHLTVRYPDKAAGSTGVELGSPGQPATVYDKTKPYDGREGYFISLGAGNRDTLSQLNDVYRTQMGYFAKYMMAQGEAHESYKNIPMAIRKLLLNSTTYNINGVTTRSGLLGLYDRYNALLTSTRTKLNSGTPLTAAERQELRDTLEEYDALVPTFRNVAELYNVVQQIRDLFPYVTTTVETQTDSGLVPNTSVMLSYENPQTQYDMIYTVKVFEPYLTDPDGTAKLSIWSKNGGQLTPTDDSLGQAPLAYTLSVNAADFALNSTQTVYDASVPASANGTYALALSYRVDAPEQVIVGLSDEIYIKFTYEYVDSNGINRVYEEVKTITVLYSSEDTYIVTIPASVEIPWGAETTDVGYQINCNLNVNSSVSVDVSFKNSAFDLTNSGTTEKISCTSQEGAPGVYSGRTTQNRTDAAQILVDAAQWNNKPVAEYRQDSAVTYTVQYTKG